MCFVFFFQAEDGIRDGHVTGVQTCALPIFTFRPRARLAWRLYCLAWRLLRAENTSPTRILDSLRTPIRAALAWPSWPPSDSDFCFGCLEFASFPAWAPYKPYGDRKSTRLNSS